MDSQLAILFKTGEWEMNVTSLGQLQVLALASLVLRLKAAAWA